MLNKIETLTVLYFLDEKKSPIVFERIRHSRVILSLFKEHIISEDEFFKIIYVLKNEKYIILHGNPTVDCQIELSTNGKGLVESIGEKVIGQTDFMRLKRLLNDYINSKPSEYMKKIGDSLKKLQEKRKEKVTTVSQDSIRAIGILCKINILEEKVNMYKYKLADEILRDSNNLDWRITLLKSQLENRFQQPVKAYLNGKFIEIITPAKMNSIDFISKDIFPESEQQVDISKISNWPLSVSYFILEKMLESIGYHKSRQTSHIFTKMSDYVTSITDAGIIRDYDTININIQELINNHVFIWINNYNSFMKSAFDLLKEKRIDLESEEDMNEFFKPIKLRIPPSFKEMELIKILPVTELKRERIPGMNQTYWEFWKNKYNISLTPDVQPIFVMKGWGNDLHYPAEMIGIDRYYLERKFKTIQGRNPKHESPKNRVEQIKELRHVFEEIVDDKLPQNAKLETVECCPPLERLSVLGAFEDVFKISPPLLEFSRGEIRIDPIDIFYNNTEPQCGKKNLSISHFISPNTYTEEMVNKIITSISRMFKSYGFGMINHQMCNIIFYDPKRDATDIEKKIRVLEKCKGDNNVGIAVIPDESANHYYTLKRLFPIRTGVPLQEITMSSGDNILKGHFKGAQFLCLKILIKSLKERESLWTLSNSAGLSSEKTLFIGIGFTRYPRENKVSKCAAVMHGPHGDRISWRVFSTLQDRTISKQWFDTLLLRIQEISEEERPSRIVFYRTGRLFPIEADSINESIDNTKWLSNFKTTFISILDGKDHRFCMANEKCENINAGICIKLNSKEAFLSTSNFDEREISVGTVIPILLKVEFGEDDISDISKEYHDLTYLNWRSPITTSKVPFVITIAERFAELDREGVPVENMFYLDL